MSQRTQQAGYESQHEAMIVRLTAQIFHRQSTWDAAPRRPWVRWTLILCVMMIGLGGLAGCQPGMRASPPVPTRTPLPTFTPEAGNAVAQLATATPPPQLASAVSEPISEPVDEPAIDPGLADAATVAEDVADTIPVDDTPAYPSPAADLLPKAGKAILVDQDRQYMYVFEDGVEIRAIPCSTGIPDKYATKAWQGSVGHYVGTFKAFGVYADYAWYLFRDNGSILIHGAPYTYEDGGGRVYLELEALGRFPASRGCIRIHPDEAVWFSFWGPEGAAVIITPWTGGQPLTEAADH